jgi:hypothetical protein
MAAEFSLKFVPDSRMSFFHLSRNDRRARNPKKVIVLFNTNLAFSFACPVGLPQARLDLFDIQISKGLMKIVGGVSESEKHQTNRLGRTLI